MLLTSKYFWDIRIIHKVTLFSPYLWAYFLGLLKPMCCGIFVSVVMSMLVMTHEFNLESFLTHSWPHVWPNSWLFSFKCPYTYTIDIFSCLFSTCTREWSKLVINTTKCENSCHLCSWHQWPFGASQSWFQKFITKSKLIQSIIYKKTSRRLAFEVFSEINILKQFPKNRFLLRSRSKKSFVWHS